MEQDKSFYTGIVGMIGAIPIALTALLFFRFDRENFAAVMLIIVVYILLTTALIASTMGYNLYRGVKGRNYVLDIVGEPKSVREMMFDLGKGKLLAIVLAIFYLSDFAWSSVAKGFGLSYSPLSSAAPRLATLGSSAAALLSPQLQILMLYSYNVVLGLGEELFMSYWRLLAMDWVASKFDVKIGSPKEIFKYPHVFAGVIVVTSIIFAALHAVVLFDKDPGYHLSVAAGNVIFTMIYFSVGFFGNWIAHGTYDFIKDMFDKTGYYQILNTGDARIVFVVLGIAVALWIIASEVKKPSK